MSSALNDTVAATDGRRPATEETWNCPSCGKSATAFVSFRRSIACASCRWIFDVSLVRHIPTGNDLYAAAKRHAEQGRAHEPETGR